MFIFSLPVTLSNPAPLSPNKRVKRLSISQTTNRLADQVLHDHSPNSNGIAKRRTSLKATESAPTTSNSSKRRVGRGYLSVIEVAGTTSGGRRPRKRFRELGKLRRRVERELVGLGREGGSGSILGRPMRSRLTSSARATSVKSDNSSKNKVPTLLREVTTTRTPAGKAIRHQNLVVATSRKAKERRG